jgi:hypothetical protein
MPAKPTKPKWPKKGTYTSERGNVSDTIERGMETTVLLKIPVVDEAGKLVGEKIMTAQLPSEDDSWAWMESWCFDNIIPGKPCGINEWLASVIERLESDSSDEMKSATQSGILYCKEALRAIAANDAPKAAGMAFKAGRFVTEYILRRHHEIDVRRSKSSVEGAKQPRGVDNPHLKYILAEHPEWLALKPTQIRAKLVANKRMAPNDKKGESGWRAADAAIRRHLKKSPR